MKKFLFVVFVAAGAVIWWLKRPDARLQRNEHTGVEGKTELNQKLRNLPPHLQRKVVNYLGEAGRFETETGPGVQLAETPPRARTISRLHGASTDLPPDVKKKLEQLPASVRQKALDMLGEAREHVSQP
jgi:hypothetical protein